MRLRLLGSLALLAACARSRAAAPLRCRPPRPSPRRSRAPGPPPGHLAGHAVAVTAPHAMVTTGHPLATEVGRSDPAARRQRDRRRGGGRVRADRGAARRGEHRRRRLHRLPGRRRTGACARLPGSGPRGRHARHVPRRRRQPDRPEHHRASLGRRAGERGGSVRSLEAVRQAALGDAGGAGDRARGGHIDRRGSQSQPGRRCRPIEPLPRVGDPVPRARTGAGPGLDVPPAGSRPHAAPHRRLGARRLLSGPHRRSDRGRDGARRRHHHPRGPRGLPAQVAHADPRSTIAATRCTRCRPPARVA